MTSKLDRTFAQLRQRGEKALIAYVMAGDPSLQETEQLVVELEQAGADIIELGVPFSDPIADGPVIQQAAERALRSGTSLRTILSMVIRLRTRTKIPLVLMAYYNSIHAFGPERFCHEAAQAGVDGLILPDMPPDEAGPLKGPAAAAGLPLIFLLAPTSTADTTDLCGSPVTGLRLLCVTDRHHRRKIAEPCRCGEERRENQKSHQPSCRGRLWGCDAGRRCQGGGHCRWGDRRQCDRQADRRTPTETRDGEACGRICPLIENRYAIGSAKITLGG